MTSIRIPGYTVIEPVAEGGMASVYLAEQESLQRKVALKILKQVESESQTRRFLSEGQIIASLSHPNIITIHDIGVYRGCHYISMAYHPGGDLESRIANGISPRCAVRLVETLARCLDHVHSRDIVHRDVKPANILFQDDCPILTDFGVAKEQTLDLGLTLDGIAIGSPHYLSPEQAQGFPIDGRTDIYGLGVVFYEMLTGTRPFEGDAVMDTLIAHLREPIPRLPIPLAVFQPIIDRMLAKSPDDRYGSAGELAAALAALPDPDRIAVDPRQAISIRTSHDLLGVAHDYIAFSRKHLSTLLRPPAGFPGGGFLAALAVLLLSVSLLFVSTTLVAPDDNGDPDLSQVSVVSVDNTSKLMDQARLALADGRLTSPASDNAHYYYRQVLSLRPNDSAAQNGIGELVDIYTDRAIHEMESLRYKRARGFIEKGLKIAPEDQHLIALQRQSHLLRDAPGQVAQQVRSFFKKNF